jgi:hypothetical protein
MHIQIRSIWMQYLFCDGTTPSSISHAGLGKGVILINCWSPLPSVLVQRFFPEAKGENKQTEHRM